MTDESKRPAIPTMHSMRHQLAIVGRASEASALYASRIGADRPLTREEKTEAFRKHVEAVS